MLSTVLYTVLALLGLSFLVFIHELGHYIVARRNGMRVEVFSIGMGKPFYTWDRKGVKWQLCYLIFGGYVKIAGQDKGEDGREPHEIPDGFAAKTPWQRIKVVAAGPIVNIVFALLVFTAIWMMGGRQKPFSQYTQLIGSVDPKSELYEKGVRSGDKITRLNNHKYGGIQDLAYASVMKSKTVEIDGEMIDYYSGRTVPFDVAVTPYEEMGAAVPGGHAFGVNAPASFMIYKSGEDFGYLPSGVGMPMHGTGIESGDRLLWADGELLFSQNDLQRVVNESIALVTVQRGNLRFMTKVPRMKLSDIRITAAEKGEVDDWQHDAKMQGNISDLYFVPYSIGSDLVVSKPFTFINDEAHQSTVRDRLEMSPLSVTLKKGDRIVAVDGRPVASGKEFLQQIQERHVQMIVQRAPLPKMTWENEDEVFSKSVNWDALSQIVASMPYGSEKHIGNLHLLRPATPMKLSEVPFPEDVKEGIATQYEVKKKKIEKIGNPDIRRKELEALESNKDRLTLGVYLADKGVLYNPTPFVLMGDVVDQTVRTFGGLFTGKLNPKWLSGPVGITHVIHQSLQIGLSEALYWLGVISLSLGIFNLLPLPVLDGGHIVFALYEWITKKRVSRKVMERMILPFVILLIAFAIFVTFNDVSRLLQFFTI